MANLIFKTKGMVNPKGKPRVYFTCHPDDFDKSFNKICRDIFKTHDCAIFYTENMTESFEDQNIDTDLGSMNLFVIPVTSTLLTRHNRAFDFDFAYAKKKHIPVLPIMLETGIDGLYSRPDKFGEMQYLNPYSTDITEIGYEDKLKKFLESVLISEEMANRVRAAFDSYIFLSYRKKDRRYANELMHLIHEKPEFRDIAVWYDEFLTPGESFNKNIEKMLTESKLFALLVTPNLLEEPNGKPNYVMENEYPAAMKIGMDILPAEMEITDKNALQSKFVDIPDIVNPRDDKAFKQRLLNSLSRVATSENDGDPEHNYLIGLAYLDGIDVEVDRQRGLSLVKGAAKDGLLEASNELIRRAIHFSDFGSDDFEEMESLYSCAIVGFEANKDNLPEESTFNYMLALYKLAGVYRLTARFSEAYNTYRNSEELANKILYSTFDNDIDVIAHLYFDYGTFCYAYFKDNAVSIEYLNKALDLFQDISLYKSHFSEYVEETKSVLETITQAPNPGGKKLYNEILIENDSRKVSTFFQYQYFYSKGDVAEREKEFDKAVMHYQSALKKAETLAEMGEDIGGKLAFADIYDRIAFCYEMSEEYDAAKEYYMRALLEATSEAKETEATKAYDSAINYAWKLASFCEEFGDEDEAKKHYSFREFLMEEKSKLESDDATSDEDFLSPEKKAELLRKLDELDFTPTTFKEGEEADYSEGLFTDEDGDHTLEALFDTLFGSDDNSHDDGKDDASIITLTDENGEDTKFEFVDLIKFLGEEYVVLLPCENDEEGVLILMVESDKESDTESYLPVEDDNLLAVIFEMFKERNKDRFNFTD